MDDFLHNLRSGKLKQPDRTNRSYGDPQYKNKRNVMDRRKRDSEAKETSERLSAIKEMLQSVAETQKRMVDWHAARAKIEERKTRALEIVARSLYRLANPQATDVEDLFPLLSKQISMEVDRTAAATPDRNQEDASRAGTNGDGDMDQDKFNGDGNRKELYDLIHKMRKDGTSWEKIARQIASQGIPTISGRGNWRGVMVKNLYEKMNTGKYN